MGLPGRGRAFTGSHSSATIQYKAAKSRDLAEKPLPHAALMFLNRKWIRQGGGSIEMHLNSGTGGISEGARCDEEEIQKGRRYF